MSEPVHKLGIAKHTGGRGEDGEGGRGGRRKEE